MKEKNVKVVFIKNMMLFLLFGIAIAVITTYINYNIEFNKIQEKIQNDSDFISRDIKSYIKNYLSKIENSIDSVNTNKLFLDYLFHPTQKTKRIAEQLFINSMKNNHNFFQFRFIDTEGNEIIRVQKKKNSNEVFIVKEENLQNKADRYYFTETLNNRIEQYWYSNFDLNVEREKIEKPLRPTLRVSKNVFYKGVHYGLLIVNVEMQDLLTYIGKNNTFDTYLIDNEGYFILNPDGSKNWSRYLDSKKTLFTEFPELTETAFNSNHFVPNAFLYNLESFFKNGENIKLGLVVKNLYIKGIENDNISYALTLGLFILLISIPIGLLISIPTSKLYIDINKLYKDNLRYIDIIDKYIPSMDVDLNKKIIQVSTALCKTSGYAKEELIGKTPSIFKSGRMNPKIYKDLWNKITSGLVWNGELENKTKNNEIYWIKSTILPNLDKDNNIESYTSLCEDITDKKKIEQISQTDKLTQLYNRVKLDESLEIEINRFMRYKNIFSIILIDVDHFKSVNDTYGHQVGDSVLVELSNLLKQHCRKTDVIGRWGGEEFMIICTDTDIKGSSHLAQQLRKNVEEFNFNIVKHKTISIGVSEVKDTDNIETLLKRVDKYLYIAKENGRNKVVSDMTE